MAKRVNKYVKKAVKQTHGVTIFCVLLFLIIGAVGGWLGYTTLTKNDKYELIGEKEITISVGGTYKDQGISIVAFGKDVSKDVSVSGEVDTSTAGVYYVTYTCTNFKYKDVKRIRKVVVSE